jgi:hypothetical protein
MKKDRVKGRWLRRIGRQKSPSPTNKAAFAKWVKDDDRFLAEQHRDIRHIVADHKPRFLSYLAREGFKTAPEICSGEWHRIQESTVLLLREAYDVEPIAYALWRALKKIEDIETALSAGDTPRACAASFRLGRLMQEADAHFATEQRTKKAGKKNAHPDRAEAVRQLSAKRRELGSAAFDKLKARQIEEKIPWFWLRKEVRGRVQNEPRYGPNQFGRILRDFRKTCRTVFGTPEP